MFAEDTYESIMHSNLTIAEVRVKAFSWILYNRIKKEIESLLQLSGVNSLHVFSFFWLYARISFVA